MVTGDGKAQLNRNVVNGSESMLRLIGDLQAGAPVAFEAVYGWDWLVELPEDCGFEPHLVYPLRLAVVTARSPPGGLLAVRGIAVFGWLTRYRCG